MSRLEHASPEGEHHPLQLACVTRQLIPLMFEEQPFFVLLKNRVLSANLNTENCS